VSDGESPKGKPSEIPMAILVAIAGGLAGLTFFTFMGGAIEVARLRGAGLSGTKSVALVPKADLLAVGAQVLVLPTIVAAVLVVFFVPAVRCSGWRGFVLFGFGTLGVAIAFTLIVSRWSIGDWNGDERLALIALVALAVIGGIAVSSLGRSAEHSGGSRLPAAVMLFLVVALFVAITSYGMGYARPTVHPVAVNVAGHCVTGVYIGENGDEVWYGTIVRKDGDTNHGDKGKGQIVAVPRADVRGVAIGAGVQLSKMDDVLTHLRKICPGK